LVVLLYVTNDRIVREQQDHGNPSPAASFNAPRSGHTGGVNVALADGSVRFVKDTISIQTWRALSTIDNGEVFSADSF